MVVAPLHAVWLATVFTVGVGLTVIIMWVEEPEQPNAAVLTVNVSVIGNMPELIAVKAGIFPVPDEAMPIAERVLVQLKVVPLTLPEKVIAVVPAPLQTV